MNKVYNRLNTLKSHYHAQEGFIAPVMEMVIGGVVLVVVIGAVIVGLWPTFVGTDTSIQALTQTDAATSTMQSLWPVALLILGISFTVAIIFYAINRLKAEM